MQLPNISAGEVELVKSALLEVRMCNTGAGLKSDS